MTEWEKLQKGLPYNDFDKELFDNRVKAKKIFKEYNKTTDDQIELRNELLTKLFKHLGSNIWLEPDFRCEFGKNISIGDNVYINFNCTILDCAEVTIGNNTLIGPNVGMYPVNHALDSNERLSGLVISKPIHIGNNVWLGGNVVITSGVSIGDNSVIGAGSVVTKDIPANVVAVGNPCRVLRSITENDKLLKL